MKKLFECRVYLRDEAIGETKKKLIQLGFEVGTDSLYNVEIKPKSKNLWDNNYSFLANGTIELWEKIFDFKPEYYKNAYKQFRITINFKIPESLPHIKSLLIGRDFNDYYLKIFEGKENEIQSKISS